MRAQVGTIRLADGTKTAWNCAWALPRGARPIRSGMAFDALPRGLANTLARLMQDPDAELPT